MIFKNGKKFDFVVGANIAKIKYASLFIVYTILHDACFSFNRDIVVKALQD